jgi:hypothetical protein
MRLCERRPNYPGTDIIPRDPECIQVETEHMHGGAPDKARTKAKPGKRKPWDPEANWSSYL